MTRDEIQKLIGGYATGSLTEAERKLLFDAALEDQELFDQLAQEQALKEMLEEPGAKQRLIAALDREKPRQVLWWPWVTAAVTASLAIVIGVVMLRTPEKPQQIAGVSKVAEALAPVVKSEPAAPVTAPATASAPKPQPEKVAKDAPAPRVFAPPSPEKGPPPATAPIELPKEEKTLEPAASPPVVAAPKDLILGFRAADENAQQQGGQIGGRALIGGAPAGIVGAAPAATAAGGGGRGGGGGGGRGGGGGGGGGAGKGGGGRGGRGGAGAPQAAARAVATRFAFDYSFDDTGALRIVPTAPGSLTMTVPAQPGPSVLLPARNVVPGTPVVVPIPPGVTEVIVSFTGTPVAGIAGTPVRRDEAAGTVEDQSPPNQRILVTIPVKP